MNAKDGIINWTLETTPKSGVSLFYVSGKLNLYHVNTFFVS